MFNKPQIMDFYVFKGPFESSRQSPNSLSGTLLFTIGLQWLFFFLIRYIGQYSALPYKAQTFSFLFWLCVILSVLSAVYAIPFIYNNSQRIQYLLVIIVSQILFGFFPLLMALVMLGTEESGLSLNQNDLIDFAKTISLIGLLIFLVTIIRLAILINKGQYRQGTRKDLLRRKYEKADYVPGVVLASLGLLYITQFLFSNIHTGFSSLMIAIAIGILVFFTMMFILPEQLLIMYCKIRFKSFNYNARGYLYSETEDKER